jgi:hypothetical protein
MPLSFTTDHEPICALADDFTPAMLCDALCPRSSLHYISAVGPPVAHSLLKKQPGLGRTPGPFSCAESSFTLRAGKATLLDSR